MWPFNKCVFYVQIQAAKPVYSDSSLDKLFCLTNRKSGNQLWQFGSVHEIYIFILLFIYYSIYILFFASIKIILITWYSVKMRLKI